MRVTQEDPLPVALGEIRRRLSDLEAQAGDRLWLPVPVWRRPDAVQTAGTTFFAGSATSWTTVWEANFPKQHSGLAIRIAAGVTVAGTAGEFRVEVTSTAGAVIVDSWSSTALGFPVQTRLVSVPGAWQEIVKVRVQYQRTSGSDSVYCHVTDMWARPV